MLSSTAVREAAASREAPAAPTLPTEASTAVFQAGSRLMDSMLHDARNPLNALAINVEVLAEKLKDDDGKVPESLDKNLRAIRDQVYRVDAILRQFADFITPRVGVAADTNLSEVVQRAVEVVSHEGRKRRVKLQTVLDGGSVVPVADAGALNLLLAQVLLRAVSRAAAGTELSIAIVKVDGRPILRVTEPQAAPVENTEPLHALARQAGVTAELTESGCSLTFRFNS